MSYFTVLESVEKWYYIYSLRIYWECRYLGKRFLSLSSGLWSGNSSVNLSRHASHRCLPSAVLAAAFLHALTLRHDIVLEWHNIHFLDSRVLFKVNNTIDEREKSVILAETDILARVDLQIGGRRCNSLNTSSKIGWKWLIWGISSTTCEHSWLNLQHFK